MTANEKWLIDANVLVRDINADPYRTESEKSYDRCLVHRQPVVDAVEVVRCKACLYRSQYSDENGFYHCGGIDTTEDHALPIVRADFFCAHGERRGDE